MKVYLVEVIYQEYKSGSINRKTIGCGVMDVFGSREKANEYLLKLKQDREINDKELIISSALNDSNERWALTIVERKGNNKEEECFAYITEKEVK